MKVLLLDADGVIFKKGSYFSTHLAQKQNVSEEIVTVFFKNKYLSCQSGELDLKEAIQPYLESWKWSGSVDELLAYWFSYDTVLDDVAIKQVCALREKGVRCYMASNNEKYRAEHIKKVLDTHGVLDGYFFSSDDSMRVRKSSPDFFRKVLAQLEIEGESVSYVDNDEKNLESARTCGISSYLYNEEILRILTVSS